MDSRTKITVAAALAAAGRYSMIWFGAAGLGLFIAADKTDFAWFLVAILFEWVLTNGPIKLLFRRARPDNSQIADLIPAWLHPPRSSSFPSGHSSAAAFSTVIWFAINPIAGVVSLLFAGVMAWSRIVIKAHHPTDVLAGFLWGGALAVAGLAVYAQI